MVVRFRCPHCQKPLTLRTTKSGGQVECPACHRSVTVPSRTNTDRPAAVSPSAANKNGISAVQPAAPPAAEPATPPPVAAPTAKSATVSFFTRTQVWIIAGSATAALFVVVGVLALILRGPSRAVPSQPPERVQAEAVEPASVSTPQPAVLASSEEKPPSTDPPPSSPVLAPAKEKPVQLNRTDEPPVPAKPKEPPPAPPKPPVVVEPPAPVQEPPRPTPPRKIIVKHRRDRSEDELRRQIDRAPELSLDRGNERTQAQRAVTLARAVKQQAGRVETVALLVKTRTDLTGLPFIMGDACHLPLPAAEHLQGTATALKGHLTAASRNERGGRPDPKQLAALLNDADQHFNKWLRPEAVPALQQVLMAEDQATREVLVEQLARIDGKRASLALAQHALFDLHPGVRAVALTALAKRPTAEFQSALLAGFRHPWPPIADHAAEALIALELRDTVPALVALLDQPHPAAPYKKPGQEGGFVREMVCLNHFRNCLLCHPASLAGDDKVRGAVPRPDQAVTGGGGGYGAQPQSIFVRADVTYLRQDFSVQRPVENHGPWPAVQRFDYLVRERPATAADVRAARELEAKGPSEHHKALFFALRELTGSDPGPTAEDWKRLFLPHGKVKRVRADLQLAGGVAADQHGRVWLGAAGEILLSNPDGILVPWLKEVDACKALALDRKGQLLACQTNKGRLVAFDLGRGTLDVLAASYKGVPLHGPRHLVLDRRGGIYFTDAAVAAPDNPAGTGGAVYYLSAQGTLTRLPISLPAPVGVALSPSEKTLYLTCAGKREVMAYPLEGVGLVGEGKVLGQMETNADAAVPIAGSLTVDGQGNVLLTNAALRAIQVFNAEGARLGLISLPETPLACTLGSEGKTLHVVSRHALYEVRLETGPELPRREP